MPSNRWHDATLPSGSQIRPIIIGDDVRGIRPPTIRLPPRTRDTLRMSSSLHTGQEIIKAAIADCLHHRHAFMRLDDAFSTISRDYPLLPFDRLRHS